MLSKSMRPMTQDGAREAVIWAYRLILNREPENDQAVNKFADTSPSIAEIRSAFLNSVEFRNRRDVFVTRIALTTGANEIEWQLDKLSSDQLLQHVSRVWTKLGEAAPHWSVLSANRFLPETIEQNLDEFFTSGSQDVSAIEAALNRNGSSLGDIGHAYEYGCGLGRVTLPLSKAIERVTAADISSSHLSMAKERIEFEGIKNIKLVHVTDGDFGMTEPFDLWYSRIVLQHNPPPIIASILAKAFKTLAPGGFAVFQVPTFAVNYSFATSSFINEMKEVGDFEMHCLPQSVIFSIANECGCVALEVREDDSVNNGDWTSNQFVFRKQHQALAPSRDPKS